MVLFFREGGLSMQCDSLDGMMESPLTFYVYGILVYTLRK